MISEKFVDAILRNPHTFLSLIIGTTCQYFSVHAYAIVIVVASLCCYNVAIVALSICSYCGF